MNGNWEHIRAILWLRWRLTRNQWRRSKGLGPVLAALGLLAGASIVVASGVGGLLGGALGLGTVRPEVILFVWDGLVVLFAFAWMIGLVAELQRSEMIDLTRLLHLPVSLNWVFVMNYFSSLLSISMAIFLPAACGLAAGLLWSRGWRMLFLFPLALSFLFMASAWSYCLRGWLISLMSNPRRRRSVIMGFTMGMILVCQLPNLIIQFAVHPRRPVPVPPPAQVVVEGGPTGTNRAPANPPAPPPVTPPDAWASMAPYLEAHAFVPILWLPFGARGLAEGRLAPAIWGTLGALLLGVAGLARAYRSTLRFYRGVGAAGPAAARAPAPGRAVLRPNFLTRRVPWVPEEVAALTLAFLRSLGRAPEAKMAFIANGIVLVVFGAMLGTGRMPRPTVGGAGELFLATAGAVFSLFGPLQILSNHFGFDREGFRCLVLLPVARHRILLAKNLALAPVVIGLGAVLIFVLGGLAHLGFPALLAGAIQLTALYLLASITGNFVSTLAPYRMMAGGLKPSKPPPKTVVLILLTHLLFPLMMAPGFVPPALGLACGRWFAWNAAYVDLAASLLLLAATVGLYALCLRPLGGFLERREKDILLVVAQEVE